MTPIGIALSGLDASTARLAASAANIANAQTSGPLAGAGSANAPAYQPVSVAQSALAGGGVSARTVGVTPATVPAYDPQSLAANAQGLVAFPNVDPAKEAVNQITALRSYQANAATIRTADAMQKSLLAIA